MSVPIRSKSFPLAGLALALMAGGCAVGPNFHRPDAPSVSGYTAQALPARTETGDQAFAPAADIPGQWWTLFKSPALNQLIVDALKANPDLAAARAALRVARENDYAQRGAFLPSVGAEYNVTRQRASGALSPPLSTSANLFTLHTAQLNIAYTLDVFGGLRRQAETTRAQAEAQRFEAQAAYLTLTSNVASTAIQEAALRDEIAATRIIIKDERDTLEVMRRQQALGAIGGADVAAQEAALALAEQTLPPLEKQLAQEQDLLAALCGRFPSERAGAAVDLANMKLPAELPVSLPSKLVEQRPDIRAAEANLHAASAQVGVAIANRLPNISLTGGAGGAATKFADMFTSGNGFWSLSGDVVQPIFQGGALYHRQRAAEAGLDQAKAQYRSAVLSAFQNVADTLRALQADDRALAAAARADASTLTSLKLARKQLEFGQVSGLAVLSAEQNYQQAVIARVAAQANRYLDTVALFQALGGGWWNRAEP